MTKVIKHLAITIILVLCTNIQVSNAKTSPLVIKVSKEFQAKTKGYQVTLQENLRSDKSYPVNNTKIKIIPEETKAIYEFAVTIKQNDKSWNADLILFPNKSNQLDFDALFFAQLIDPGDFKHLDIKTTTKFYHSYNKHIPAAYKSNKAKFNTNLEDYLNHVSVLYDSKNYLENIYPISQKLKDAASKLTTKDQKPHKKIITQFIKDINRKNTNALIKLQDPASKEKYKDIYSRGLKTLYAYFDRIGNPGEFKIVSERIFNNNVYQVTTNYFLIELINHNGSLNKKIEMEFFFRDSFGKRYIDEYDITGINFK